MIFSESAIRNEGRGSEAEADGGVSAAKQKTIKLDGANSMPSINRKGEGGIPTITAGQGGTEGLGNERAISEKPFHVMGSSEEKGRERHKTIPDRSGKSKKDGRGGGWGGGGGGGGVGGGGGLKHTGYQKIYRRVLREMKRQTILVPQTQPHSAGSRYNCLALLSLKRQVEYTWCARKKSKRPY